MYTELLTTKGCMITAATYRKRVLQNTETFNKQKQNNSFDLKQYHGFDLEAGQASSTTLSSKSHDIRCAVILGFLPILGKKTGPDAIKLTGKIFSSVELKSSYTDESKFYKTIKDTVYSVSPGKIVNGVVFRKDTTSIKSVFNASYNIKDNISSKGIDTYLILLDSRNEDVIDCFEVTGDVMMDYLNDRTIPASGSLTIKLSIFISKGSRAKSAIPVIGFDKWENFLLPVLPVVRVIEDEVSKQKRIISAKLKKLSCLN